MLSYNYEYLIIRRWEMQELHLHLSKRDGEQTRNTDHVILSWVQFWQITLLLWTCDTLSLMNEYDVSFSVLKWLLCVSHKLFR